MARKEVAEKLTVLLSSSEWNEPNVVYFFVMSRKLLDHRRIAGGSDLPNLRFFCDWVVHISKDNIDVTTLKILRELQADIEKQIMSPTQEAARASISFIYFEHLKPELVTLLKDEGISTDWLGSYDKWTALISHLVKILENQPLVVSPSYGLNIKELIFTPSTPRTVVMLVNFVSPTNGYDGKELRYFKLLNGY